MISVIIPNYNGIKYLEPCLQSVLEQDGFDEDLEILLIDNGSSDGSVSFVKEHFPNVICEMLAENTGFTGATNHGASLARGELLLFLNNDTVLRPRSLSKLQSVLRSGHAKLGGVQPLLLLAENPQQIDSAGIALNSRFVARDDWSGFSVSKAEAASGEIWGTCFACVLMRPECFEQNGRLDPDYFAEWDDVDFCLRARWMGWTFELAAEAEVLHHRSPTQKIMPRARYVRHRRNQLWTYIKALPAGMAFQRIVYRIQQDLFQLPHYARKRQLGTVIESWRAAWRNREVMLSRRSQLMERALLSPREMKQQLKRFMLVGASVQRRQRRMTGR